MNTRACLESATGWFTTAAVVALVGCSEVVFAPGEGGGTVGEGGEAQGGTSNTGGASTGAGGGRVVPLECADGASVTIAAAGQGSVAISTVQGGTWSTVWTGSPMVAMKAHSDPYRRLGAIMNDSENVTHLLTEVEPGLMAESPTSFVAWPPFLLPTNSPQGVPGLLLSQGPEGWQLAFYDSDAQDWSRSQLLPAYPWTPSSLALDPTTGRVTIVGRTGSGEVCYADTGSDGALGASSCVPGIASPQDEIVNSPPQVLALDNGGTAIVFSPQLLGSLAVVVRHGATWSSPVALASEAIGIAFSATTSTSDDLVVGTLSTAGELSLLRFDEAQGWRGPTAVGTGFSPYPGTVVAAPGNCGADAFLGVARGGVSVDVARVYGMESAVDTVLSFGDDFAFEISFVSRSAIR